MLKSYISHGLSSTSLHVAREKSIENKYKTVNEKNDKILQNRTSGHHCDQLQSVEKKWKGKTEDKKFTKFLIKNI